MQAGAKTRTTPQMERDKAQLNALRRAKYEAEDRHSKYEDELLERFRCRDDADIEEDLMPKSGVQEMQHGMLAPTDVEVDRHPILFFHRVDYLTIVFRIEKPQIVPTGSGPLGHGIGFASRRLPAIRVCRFEPMLQIGQRALPVA